MAIKKYKKTAETKLSENFRISEFHCKGKNCCSVTYIDEKLIQLLQKLRDHLGKPININSGYRCEKHNSAVGGVAASNHVKGKAADIIAPGVAPLEVAKAAETVGFKGIILYTRKKFVHVAVRDTKSFQKNNGLKITNVKTFGGGKQCPYSEAAEALRHGDKGDDVKWLQWMLRECGYSLEIDGSFGPRTRAAVRTFQANHSLQTDGIAGPKTKSKLKAVV